ncbi:hypothetical protein M413DRAFT_441785 [Hebeloma cylindrosporum]|uniref:BZIP domain-containing protein n=1 Tax=Hebeloma cylindrosporum TaxID=76867 RepID=A0A0C2Y5M3_HEBCY|nr:hypothetical protein M413DRAFT_441785 [Hebeloma cylindrosporum h7]
MTRGRKKDLSIPPSRSLVQQRDYRARKASYIASLEERCRKVEEENAHLKKELMHMKAQLSIPAILRPDAAEASKELMQSLVIASTSLANFQRLAFSEAQPIQETISRAESHEHPNQVTANQSSSTTRNQAVNVMGKKRLYTDNTPPFSPILQSVSTSSFRSPSPESDEECCGGIVDCDAMESDRIIQHEEEGMGGTALRMSELRSTADHRLQAEFIQSI